MGRVSWRGSSSAYLRSWVAASNTQSLISIMDDGHASAVKYVSANSSQKTRVVSCQSNPKRKHIAPPRSMHAMVDVLLPDH